ncbi:MAG: SGNH/GDSL hydrolase family protein [Polyangiales bacterium]
MPRRITLLLFALCACGDDVQALTDSATDAGTTPDASSDVAASDAGPRGDASVFDAGADAGRDAGSDGGSDAGPTGVVAYTSDRLHSPIPASLVAELQARAAPDRVANVFAKVGDSITVSTNYLRCFGGERFDLDGRSLEETRAFYDGGDAAGDDPFRRESGAAAVGWHAGRALAGSPSPLDQELAALRPAVATVMFGTNDIGITGLEGFAENLYDVVDTVLASGAIPIMSTIPARQDSASANAEVPRFNLVARAIAQTRQVPLVDLHRSLAPLDGRGLGGDNLHPSSFRGGACMLTEEGLAFGYNMRNLVTLEALDRTRRALAGEALDEASPRVIGAGAHDAPFEIGALPFVHGDDTMRSRERRFDAYDGCSATQNESGPELIYRVALTGPTTLRARVFDRGSVDVDVHILTRLETAACVARDHNEASARVEGSEAFIVVDSWVGDAERGGEFLLVVDAI